MLVTDAISIVLLVLALGAQHMGRSFWLRNLKRVFSVAIFLMFGIVVFWSFLQYKVWFENPIFSKFLLPPYRGIDYFLGYVGTRFFAPFLIALAAAIALPAITRDLNKRFGDRFFEPEEIPMFALGIFLANYPGFLFYIAFMMIAAVLLSLYYVVRGWGRAPLYHLWLPVAIFAIIIKIWVIPAEFLALYNL